MAGRLASNIAVQCVQSVQYVLSNSCEQTLYNVYNVLHGIYLLTSDIGYAHPHWRSAIPSPFSIFSRLGLTSMHLDFV